MIKVDIIKDNIGFKKITFLVIIASLFFINSSFLEKSYSTPSMIEYKMNNNQNQYSLITVGMDSNSISDVLPATIQMIYNNQTYEGKPIFSIYRGDSSFSAFQKPQFNISNINTKIINVENGSEVEFKIIDYPQVLKPSYLGITAYNEAGEVTQIIESEEFYQTNSSGTNKVKVDMEEGVYTLIATATWDGETEDVEGFQLNAFKINLINDGK